VARSFAVAFIFASSLVFADPMIYVDEPEGCLQGAKYPCAVRILKNNYKLSSELATMWGSDGVSFVLGQGKELRVLDGELLLTTKVPVEIDQGLIRINGNGDLWLSKKGARIFVRNLLGDLNVRGTTGGFTDEISPGFEKWYEGINDQGKIEQGTLAAINASSFLPHWARMTALEKDQSREKIEAFKKSWKGSVVELSKFYQQVVERRLASQEETERQKEHRQMLEMQERQRLLQMFRKKQYLDQF
jgi:hypothetical protein